VNVENVTNIHDALEAVVAADGQTMRISRMVMHYRAHLAATNFFTAQAVLVQTAGTLSDTTDIADGSPIDTALDQACDDVLGYTKLGKLAVPRFAPVNGTTQLEIVRSVPFPQGIIQLLNKELETERLQDLYLALVFFGCTNAAHYVSMDIEVDYTTVRKTISLR
jgi:hypothetical protein